MILYHVRAFADTQEFGHRINPMEMEETAKSFVGGGKRISKEKLMKIDTIWIENHRLIHYHTFCVEGQQQAAIDMLKAHVIAKANQYKAELDAILEIINRQP